MQRSRYRQRWMVLSKHPHLSHGKFLGCPNRTVSKPQRSLEQTPAANSNGKIRGEAEEHYRLAFVDLRHFAVSDGSASSAPITLDTYSDDIETLDVFRQFFVDYDFLADLLPLPMPVLAAMGRHDYAVPHSLWERLLPELRTVSYHLFELSGHTPQLEEQALFDQVLIQWLP